jgi:hypothetical protein
MQAGTVNVSVSDGFEDAVAATEREFEDQVRLMAAPAGCHFRPLKMFELGKLSSGQAAQLAGRSPGTTSSRSSGRMRAEFFES